MSAESVFGLVAVILLIIGNAFFVAGEFALVAVDKTRMSNLADEGNRRARSVIASLKRLSFELSGAQLGITVTSLVLGFVAEPTIGELLEGPLEPLVGEDAVTGISVAVALFLATTVQMVFGELVPKNVAIAKPEGTALWIGPAMRFVNTVAGPLIRFLNGSANRTVKAFGIEPREELESVRSLEELEVLIETSGQVGTLEEAEHDLVSRTIRFGDKTAADALVPRTTVTAVGYDDTVASLIDQARQTGFSRFPVQGDDLDDVRGVVHIRSALSIPAERRGATLVSELAVEPVVIPESLSLDDLLVKMRAGRSQMAVVIDEYGGTAGIITIEDLLEELVGEIRDEYDRPDSPHGRLTLPWQRGVSVMEGNLHRDEVRELCGLEMPDGDFETLAGYLLVLFDRIPQAGDTCQAEDGWAFEVLEMDGLRIALVRAVAPPPDPDDVELFS